MRRDARLRWFLEFFIKTVRTENHGDGTIQGISLPIFANPAVDGTGIALTERSAHKKTQQMQQYIDDPCAPEKQPETQHSFGSFGRSFGTPVYLIDGNSIISE
jgi:hypothetical protein